MEAQGEPRPDEDEGTDAARGADAEHAGDEAPWLEEREETDS